MNKAPSIDYADSDFLSSVTGGDRLVWRAFSCFADGWSVKLKSLDVVV